MAGNRRHLLTAYTDSTTSDTTDTTDTTYHWYHWYHTSWQHNDRCSIIPISAIVEVVSVHRRLYAMRSWQNNFACQRDKLELAWMVERHRGALQRFVEFCREFTARCAFATGHRV